MRSKKDEKKQFKKSQIPLNKKETKVQTKTIKPVNKEEEKKSISQTNKIEETKKNNITENQKQNKLEEYKISPNSKEIQFYYFSQNKNDSYYLSSTSSNNFTIELKKFKMGIYYCELPFQSGQYYTLDNKDKEIDKIEFIAQGKYYYKNNKVIQVRHQNNQELVLKKILLQLNNPDDNQVQQFSEF